MHRKHRGLSTSWILLVLSLIAFASTNASNPCDLRTTKHGSVCVCTETYCDFLDDPTPADEQEFVVVSSTKAGLRFDTYAGKFNVFRKHFILDYDRRLPKDAQQTDAALNRSARQTRAANTRQARLTINRAKKYQSIVGFGGSFTGAVSHIIAQFPQPLQDHVYDSCYSQRGIGFNLLRMSIGGCDFDLAPWAYNEQPVNDVQLTNFTLDPRDEQKVRQIKRLIEVADAKKLRIKGAAWSAPPWMKSNNAWTGRSMLKKEYYQTWADYHLKWLELMESNGLPIWAISTGNEPLNGLTFWLLVKFMSMGWTPQHQAIWLADNLGPTIRNSKHKDLLIFGNDDQRYTYAKWFDLMKSVRNNSLDYLNGLAAHWYFDEIVSPSIMEKTLAEMPEKILLTTESCIGDKPWHKAAPLLGSWERGEKLTRAVLQNLQHSYNGWIDWNIILDEQGGPNYANNFVDAPIIANMTNLSEVYKQPLFYSMGHFSKFIPEGSIRIDAVRNNVNVDTVAFLRPDGSIASVVFNSGNADVDLGFEDSERGTIHINLPAKSMHTIVYK